MRLRKAYCETLGLTQQEIALVLSVSRSAWSMYVLGRREIPTESFELLQEMLNYVARESDARAGKSAAADWQGLEKYIEKKHHKITKDHQSVSLNPGATRKSERAASRELSRKFLAQKQNSESNKRFGELARLLESGLKEKKALFNQEFRKATLEFQRQWLESQLTKG